MVPDCGAQVTACCRDDATYRWVLAHEWGGLYQYLLVDEWDQVTRPETVAAWVQEWVLGLHWDGLGLA